MLVRIVSLLAIHKPLEIINFVSSDGLFNWILMLPFYFIYLLLLLLLLILLLLFFFFYQLFDAFYNCY